MIIEPLTLALAVVLAVAGGGFRGFAGFGSALLMAPLLTLLVVPTVAVPTLMILSLLGTLRLLPEVYREVDVRRVVSIGIPAMVFIPIGLFVLKGVEAELLRRIVSGIVLLLVLLLASGMRFRNARRPQVLAPMGVASGVLIGLGAVGGPPVVVTFLSIDDPAHVTRANLIAYFSLTGVAAVLLMFLSGVWSREAATLTMFTAPGFLLAIHLGARAFQKSDQQRYRNVALGFLAAVAAVGLIWP